jgi:hypothetical protein
VTPKYYSQLVTCVQPQCEGSAEEITAIYMDLAFGLNMVIAQVEKIEKLRKAIHTFMVMNYSGQGCW